MDQETLRVQLVYSPRSPIAADYARLIARQFESLAIERDRAPSGICVRVSASEPARAIDWSRAKYNVVFVISDEEIVEDAQNGFRELLGDVRAHLDDERALIINIAITASGMQLRGFGDQQTYRHFETREDHCLTEADGSLTEPARRLILACLSLCGGFLRRGLAAEEAQGAAAAKPEPIRVFLSHSHATGRTLALQISKRLTEAHPRAMGVGAFLDSEELPPGRNFIETFRKAIEDGAFLAIQTDDYATRPFCRWEMLTAKHFRRPILIAHMLSEGEARVFPYAGNTPLLVVGHRAGEASETQLALEIDTLLIALMSETLRSLVFLHDVEAARRARGDVAVDPLPRPPELADLALILRNYYSRPDTEMVPVVYPDPPLDETEMHLIGALPAPFEVQSLSEYRSGTRMPPRPLSAVYRRPLERQLIGIGASPVDPEAALGLGFLSNEGGPIAQQQALAQVVTVIAQLGGRIGYGGNLNTQPNTTLQLFQEVVDAYRVFGASEGDLFEHYLAHPFWRDETKLAPGALYEHLKRMALLGRVNLFLPDGSALRLRQSDREGTELVFRARAETGEATRLDGCYTGVPGIARIYEAVPEPAQDAASGALSAMRATMARTEAARVVIGGNTGGVYSGRAPGVMEEAIETLRADKLLLVLGAFGGGAMAVAQALDLWPDAPMATDDNAGAGFRAAVAELRRLASHHHGLVLAHGIDPAEMKALARADSPVEIAERCRSILVTGIARRPPATG